MVNSDQTWNGNKNNIISVLNVGYLKFAENWTIPRFVYGASLGVNYWKFSKDFDLIARRLLKKFLGTSVREKGAMNCTRRRMSNGESVILCHVTSLTDGGLLVSGI